MKSEPAIPFTALSPDPQPSPANRRSPLNFVRSQFAGALAMCFLATPSVAQEVLASPLINQANGNTYYLLSAAPWNVSQTAAVSLGGHLVHIDNAAENRWVHQTFVPIVSGGGDQGNLWIGLSDQEREGVFVWTDGTTPTYTNWSPGEPNNVNNEDAAHMVGTGFRGHAPGQWNDILVSGLGGGGLVTPPYGVVELEVGRPLSVFPDHGGNSGRVTLHVNGANFLGDETVRLARSGFHDVVGSPVTSFGGTTLSTTIDLEDVAAGSWDVVVESPSRAARVLPAGFEVIEGGSAHLWMDFVGLDVIQPGFPRTFWLVVGNEGSVDSGYAWALLRFPETLEYDPGVPAGFSTSPDVYAPDGLHELAYGIPPIPAGSSISIPLRMTAQTQENFEIRGDLLVPIERSTQGDSISVSAALNEGQPILWDHETLGHPPAGYIVIYDDFGGNDSVAISLGNGFVAHFLRNDEDPDLDGLRVHAFDANGIHFPTTIIQPLEWTQAKGDARAQDFYARWTPGTDWFDGQPTSYENNQGEQHSFPGMNCYGWVRLLWPELQEFDTWSFPLLVEAGGQLRYWLFRWSSTP